MKRIPKILKVIIILVVILLAGLGTFYYLNRVGHVNTKPTDQEILAQLKKIILLPDNVTPTMAIVMNADALKKEQPAFFANVKNNDRLIIYPDLVIIYDYSANKIIKVGPVQNVPAQNK